MSDFVCDICNLDFKSKFGLEKHKKKKNKCNIITNYQCAKCTKYFKSKQSLDNHNQKCTKEIVLFNNQFDDEYDEGFIDSPIEERSDVNWLKSIINSSMNDDMKVGILSNYNEILGTDKITAVIKSDMPLIDKIFTIHRIGKPKTNTKITNAMVPTLK